MSVATADCSAAGCHYAFAGYAAQSLLAAIGCVQFVSNVLFASFVLKEQVRPTACASQQQQQQQ